MSSLVLRKQSVYAELCILIEKINSQSSILKFEHISQESVDAATLEELVDLRTDLQITYCTYTDGVVCDGLGVS